MKRTVKNRIRLGTIFLFLLVVLSAGFSIYYLASLRLKSKNILLANYESLEYGHTMLNAMDQMETGNKSYIDTFQIALTRESDNITEIGEQAVVNALGTDFRKLISGDTALKTKLQIREHILTMLNLNMRAIQGKSNAAESLAENALSYQVLIASIIFIIGFSFAYNFPSVLTSPIRKLTEAIHAIADKDYSHRVHIESKDEFGELANAFNEMAERLQFFETSNLQQILFEKARAEAVINSFRDASIGIDSSDIVLFANNQALSLLELESTEIVGKPVTEVAGRNDLFRFLMEEKSTLPVKIVVEGRENYFVKEQLEITASNSRVIVLKNITSFKELDVAKTNFIATISHELKTPLASSDFSLKLLSDERIGKLSAEQLELTKSLRQDNQRMLRILSELLNMAQVEAGKIAIDLQPTRPDHLVRAAIAAVANAAKEKHITVNVQTDDNILDVKADEEKTVWVLTNLLSNAIKHSPDHSTVQLIVHSANKQVIFKVRDEGPGIAPEYLPRLFERFFKVPGSKTKGTGLGLSICKEFIEAEGGTIQVKSDLGVGSTFQVTLPQAVV